MTTINQFMASPRARSVIADVAQGINRLMACGDARTATMLSTFGLTVLVDSAKREFTGAYRLTPAGVNWVRVNLSKLQIEEGSIQHG